MRKIFIAAVLMIAAALAFGLNGCLLEDREVEVVVNHEHCEEFTEYHTSEDYSTPKTIDFDEDLDELLEGTEFSRDQIVDAFLVSAFYEVTEFSQTTDWVITGTITIERKDIVSPGPVTLIKYSKVPLAEKLGEKTRIKLSPEGVAVVNQAMDDYIAWESPKLELTVVSVDGVEPSPTGTNPLIFTWKACLNIQVIGTIETQIINPAGGS